MIKNWVIVPDGISDGEHTILYKDERSLPFYITKSHGVFCGYNGSSHSIPASDKESLIMLKLMRNVKSIPNYLEDAFPEVDTSKARGGFEKLLPCAKIVIGDIICDGRCFDLSEEFDTIVFTFWKKLPSEMTDEVMDAVCQEKGLNRDLCVKASVSSEYDYEQGEFRADSLQTSPEEEQAVLDSMHQIHNPEFIPGEGVEDREEFEKRKKEETANFRTDRDAVHDKELEYENPRDGYPMMTRAEYNHLTKMDEGQHSRKAINEELQNNPNILWHGSPHLFDTFSMSKINTGQHSQDFGRGLYFTTDRETGVFYCDELSHKMSVKDKFDKYVHSIKPDDILSDYLNKDYSVSVKRIVKSMLSNGEGDEKELESFLNSLDKTERYAYLYKVRIDNPQYIPLKEYKTALIKTGMDEETFQEKLKGYGYNGIIYDMNTRGCSDRDFTNEKNVVIFDDKCINVIDVKKLEFDGSMKIDSVANDNKKHLFLNENQLTYLKRIINKK